MNICLRFKQFRDKNERIFTCIINAILLVLFLSIIAWVMVISVYVGDDMFVLTENDKPMAPIYGWLMALLFGGVALILIIVCAGYAINNKDPAPEKAKVGAFILLVFGAGTIPFNTWGMVMDSF